MIVSIIVFFSFGFRIVAEADVLIDATPEISIPATPESDHLQKTGWNSSKTSYYRDGKKLKGIHKIDGALYYFKTNGSLYKKTGLNTIKGKTYYFTKQFTLKTGVTKVGKKHYFFLKKNGERYERKGIKKLDGKYYCFDVDFSLDTGWKRDKKNNRMFFSKKNYSALVGWHYIGKYKYYFKSNARLDQDIRDRLTKKQKSSYLIKVNRLASCVTVYVKDGKKGYTIPIVSFICSAGEATPIGSFHIRDKLRWHELVGPSWGQWCEHITSDILFHSVYYNKKYDNKSLSVFAYKQLGNIASHGCIRLVAGDAKWIYDNCKVGTKVIIYNSKYHGPFDKPKAMQLKPGQTWDPTDPTI